MIHVKTPFRLDKNLGLAYNQAFEGVPEDDWVCLKDRDVMFLTPNSITLMYHYISLHPDAMFTCKTNRIHPLATDQLFLTEPSNNFDVTYWETLAELKEKELVSVSSINHPISGFLMLISKRQLNEIKFSEFGGCLGVDNDYTHRVLEAGYKIYCMNTLLVWHTYRTKNVRDKSHLL